MDTVGGLVPLGSIGDLNGHGEIIVKDVLSPTGLNPTVGQSGGGSNGEGGKKGEADRFEVDHGWLGWSP